DCIVEILDVLFVGFLTASGIGGLFLGKALGRALGFEVGANPLNGRPCCPNAAGKDLAALLFGNDPMIPSSLHTPGKASITGRQEYPALRCGQELAIGSTDGVRGWAGGDELVAHSPPACLRFRLSSLLG